jgi:hypothetical protein
MGNAIEARPLLVFGVHDVPGAVDVRTTREIPNRSPEPAGEVWIEVTGQAIDRAGHMDGMGGGFPVNAQGSSITDKFSLVIGGPFYRALRRTHLPNIGRRIFVFVAVTWLPLLVLSFVQGTALGNRVKIPLMYDFSIYGRFLVALPLLIVAETVIDPFIGRVVALFNSSGIVRENDLPVYHAALERIARLRDSRFAEFLFALVAFSPFFLLADYQWSSNQVSSWHGSTSGGLSAAGWAFVFVASPVPRFLLLRWLWRYALWSALLRSVAKLNLHLVPTHPDMLGGLGPVLTAQRQFGILFAALGSVLAGQFGNEIAYFGERFDALEGPIIAFVLMAILIVLLPLTLLTPRLIEARRSGLVRYGQVARRLGDSFDAKWVQTADSPPPDMIGSQDPSSLIDYISCVSVIRGMQVIPLSKRLVISVAAQAFAPFALVWIFATPVDQIIAQIVKRLL